MAKAVYWTHDMPPREFLDTLINHCKEEFIALHIYNWNYATGMGLMGFTKSKGRSYERLNESYFRAKKRLKEPASALLSAGRHLYLKNMTLILECYSVAYGIERKFITQAARDLTRDVLEGRITKTAPVYKIMTTRLAQSDRNKPA